MTTTVFFVRHGAHDLLGRVLAGRAPGVPLNAEGRRQAERAAAWLENRGLGALYVSPMQRARETAAPIADRLGLEAKQAPDLDEIDMGRWTGLTLDALHGDPAWRRWNEDRSQHCAPGGESMLEVQVRVASWLEAVTAAHPDQRLAAVCHADVIKAAICHAAGLPLDQHQRIDIDPGSVSVVVTGDWGLKLHSLNEAPR